MNVPLNAPVSAVAGAATAAPPRLAHVDALRGFALFGILVVNIGVFASPFYANGITDPAFSRPWDLAMRWLVAWLFETKFYLLFSFLFGYSFTLQMSAAERGGAAFGPRFLRRLLGLALLGLAHAVLFYQGDILLTYAALGVVLMACRRMDPGRALRRALWLIGLVSLAWTLLGALSLLDPAGTVELSRAANGVAVADSQAAIEAYRGTIGSTVARHWHELTTSIWGVILLVQGPLSSPCSWSATRWAGARRWPIRGASRARCGCCARWGRCPGWPGPPPMRPPPCRRCPRCGKPRAWPWTCSRRRC